jgi:tRNA G18 (ribose-2'-O)-methylase SpoU
MDADKADMSNDTRNVTDEFRGKSVEKIKDTLRSRRTSLQIAIENVERDFNMGTIVRTANAFNVSAIHVVGRRQWNKRGAMVTDKYMDIYYHASVDEFVSAVHGEIIAVDNIKGSKNLAESALPKNAILVFGSEANGLSQTMIESASQLIQIEQFGSTRSVNVGVASGIVMYAWMQQNVL